MMIMIAGQFGVPRFSVGLALGFLASCVACSVESLGAYGTLARVSEEKPPPASTLNRAIAVEGFGCCLAGEQQLHDGNNNY